MNKLFLALAILANTVPTAEEPTTGFSNVSIEYMKGSVVENVLTLSTRTNEDETVDLLLEFNFPFGYTIYDDADTAYIDGLLVNGNYLSDYTIPNYVAETDYTITVKTAYMNDITGSLAKLQDGNWSLIFKNPLTTIQITYYVLATLTVVITFIITKKDTKKRLKNADDVIGTVGGITEKGKDELVNSSIELLSKTIQPLLQRLELSNNTIIKALALMSSNSKDAPLQILNLLESYVQGSDISQLVDTIKEELLSKLAVERELKQKTLKALETITESQEVKKDEQSTQKETKSIF